MLLAMAACSDEPPSCRFHDAVLLTEQRTDEGQVRVVVGSDEFTFPLVKGGYDSEPPKDRCRVTLLEWQVLGGGDSTDGREHDLSATDSLGTAAELRCNFDLPRLYRALHIVGEARDIRLLEVGEPSTGPNFSCWSCANRSEERELCAPRVGPVVTLEAISGTGEALPYPELVTDDFRRVVHVELEMSIVAEEGCGEGSSVLAEAMFDVGRARYEAQGRVQVCAL
jgi:hypothetical protein